MAPNSKPHILLVHGAWHSPLTFNNLRAVLTHQHALSSSTVTLPSTGASPPHTDATQDTTAVRTSLSRLIKDDRQDVILVLHSYGAIPGSNACEGLLKVDRPTDSGGIIHVIYLAAFMLPVGTSIFSFLTEPASWQDATTKPGYLVVKEQDAIDHFYNGMPHAQALECVKLLRDQSLGPCADSVKFTPWPSVGATYVVAEEDEAIRERESERMFAAQGWEGRVVRLKGHHCLYVDQPEAVAGVIGDVVELC